MQSHLQKRQKLIKLKKYYKFQDTFFTHLSLSMVANGKGKPGYQGKVREFLISHGNF